MKRALMLVLLLATPASARGWRQERCEWAADLEYARYLYQLECNQLPAAAEWQRQVVNQQVYGAYQRWQPAAAPEPAADTAMRPRPRR